MKDSSVLGDFSLDLMKNIVVVVYDATPPIVTVGEELIVGWKKSMV